MVKCNHAPVEENGPVIRLIDLNVRYMKSNPRHPRGGLEISGEGDGMDKVEIGCLTCETKFSVEDQDEPNWICPVCSLHLLIKEIADLLASLHLLMSKDDINNITAMLSREEVKKIRGGGSQ